MSFLDQFLPVAAGLMYVWALFRIPEKITGVMRLGMYVVIVFVISFLYSCASVIVDFFQGDETTHVLAHVEAAAVMLFVCWVYSEEIKFTYFVVKYRDAISVAIEREEQDDDS
ncbi:MAG TPA: hypothetical protein VKP88_07650 [Candidatus Paceibacterota bacterium]|nr:hypothetical protein [Candidatus Paceibacterota bacterium]